MIRKIFIYGLFIILGFGIGGAMTVHHSIKQIEAQNKIVASEMAKIQMLMFTDAYEQGKADKDVTLKAIDMVNTEMISNLFNEEIKSLSAKMKDDIESGIVKPLSEKEYEIKQQKDLIEATQSLMDTVKEVTEK